MRLDPRSSGVLSARSDGTSFDPAVLGLRDMAYSAGGWRNGQHQRVVADVNGDGLDDLVGFGDSNTLVALSNGDGTFMTVRAWSRDYASNDGWNAGRHERLVGDVNGDGMADIVAFGDRGTEVALSTGAGFEDGFVWINDFDYAHGWRIGNHERVLADVNGDGRDDIVGFGASRIIVSISDGTGFDPIEFWSSSFTTRQGWRENIRERTAADVNGDGMADVVAFGDEGVQVALSNGNGFDTARIWSEGFGSEYGWNQDDDTRRVADVNGDGLADIVAFGNDGIRIALSDGARFVDPYEGAAPFPVFKVAEDTLPVDLLVNGDLDSSIADGRWTANGDVDGWTNDNGGIEAWGRGFLGIRTEDNGTIVDLDRHSGGNEDNLYQYVQTEEGQRLELSFSAMQRDGDSDHIEFYWRGELINTVQPESNEEWSTYTFSVSGSGELDRLEFKELAEENDGSGPLIDNISLLDVSEALM